MPNDAIDLMKHAACEAIDSLEPELLRVSHAIHAQPELAFEETHAAALLADTLRGAELEVESGAYGLDTAFASEFGAAGDASVAILAEYDALPEIGHACGHNLIATSGVGAGIALAALATRPLQIVLYEVDARDPVIFGGVVLILALVGVLASYIPARRVSQIHPAEALQSG